MCKRREQRNEDARSVGSVGDEVTELLHVKVLKIGYCDSKHYTGGIEGIQVNSVGHQLYCDGQELIANKLPTLGPLPNVNKDTVC